MKKYKRIKLGVLVQEHNRHRPPLCNYLLDEVGGQFTEEEIMLLLSINDLSDEELGIENNIDKKKGEENNE